DLPAMLALAIAGAALAKVYQVQVRQGWTEPTNLFTVTALPPGERKSAVFKAALAPVVAYEQQLQAEEGPRVAELASIHRTLELQLKSAEKKAAAAAADICEA